MPRKTAASPLRVDGAPAALSLDIDANGSPVTLQEAEWLVCFVPGLRRQWWHRFVHARHKHVFAMRMVDEQTWLVVEPWWTRLMVNVLSFDQALHFLRWAAAGSVVKVREAIPGRGSQLRGWSNCAVLVSFLLGRSYRTWTPNGLYRKLLAEEDAQPVDVPRLLIEHVGAMAGEAARRAVGLQPGHEPVPLDRLLFRLGRGIAGSMLPASVIGLHQFAASGFDRSSDAADVYWAKAMERAVEHIRGVLEDARRRGEIHVADCALAARQFVAMLRGDMHLELLFGVRAATPPDEADIHAHVESVVDIFLHGAAIASRCGRVL
ncbi:TetR/AcrR family transcriptional regulator C-terminal domain-containing protein [Frateuria hangzhouensis]|uniref:TetR/AcrR family transcriptional regulator C-terminal domain-containing protein n=1 Tax=Frateuria hangzhouensis TaxID=2995589 RepID=UPI002260F4C1|nr:TetR/AcrR family transcriptional regulator C-terminal domain-containing protein [Frateuria sp. STR12]MCX7512272.1 TetR/AcrR family transcriptional regulator C-terminal domain-containing protein [Frateuria sp. STR12]